MSDYCIFENYRSKITFEIVTQTIF